MALPLDLEALRAALRAGQSFRYRFFWGHTPGEDGALSDAVFSQWWPATFELEGHVYRTAEQWMMAEKARLSGDEATRAAILEAPEPARSKKLGRQVKGFDEARWAAVRFDLVTTGNLAKFEQDPALRAYLLSTGDDVLVEASPFDQISGIRAGGRLAGGPGPGHLAWPEPARLRAHADARGAPGELPPPRR
ncbi:MAG: NADAR family protein [Anaeromyxobacter sp.]